MINPHVAYFFKKFYNNIIKCWFVIYNPIARIISYSKEDEEYTKQLQEEKDEAKRVRARKYAESNNIPLPEEYAQPKTPVSDSNYNHTTGSFSGLYGQTPVDAGTQTLLDDIISRSSSQSNIDSLFSGQARNFSTEPVPMDDEQESVIQEANEIYERLLKEAAENAAKKQAEIELAKAEAELKFRS